MKSLNRSTPLVRISKSSGGQSAVNKWSVMVCAVIDSMSISPEVTVLVDELDVEMEESLAEGEGVEFRGIVEEETISRIAVVISSREVYGKQTFNIALPSFLLNTTPALSEKEGMWKLLFIMFCHFCRLLDRLQNILP